jgi:hypothetical protein
MASGTHRVDNLASRNGESASELGRGLCVVEGKDLGPRLKEEVQGFRILGLGRGLLDFASSREEIRLSNA